MAGAGSGEGQDASSFGGGGGAGGGGELSGELLRLLGPSAESEGRALGALFLQRRSDKALPRRTSTPHGLALLDGPVGYLAITLPYTLCGLPARLYAGCNQERVVVYPRSLLPHAPLSNAHAPRSTTPGGPCAVGDALAGGMDDPRP